MNRFPVRYRLVKARWLLTVLVLYAWAGMPRRTVPDFTLYDTGGTARSWSELKGGTVTLIDFWATWCVPCLRSMPRLEKLFTAYREQGVRIIGINVDGTRNAAKVGPTVQSLGITYPILVDENSDLMRLLKVTAVPTLFVVNSRGEIVYSHQGFSRGEEKVIEEEVRKLLQAANTPEEKPGENR